MSSLLRLQIGSGLLDQFKSCFLVIKNTSASLAVGRGARVTLEGRDAETLWACSCLPVVVKGRRVVMFKWNGWRVGDGDLRRRGKNVINHLVIKISKN